MATLKYKNGDSWEAIEIETKTETILSTSWPIGSCYIRLKGYMPNYNIDNLTITPGALFGGTWTLYNPVTQRYFLGTTGGSNLQYLGQGNNPVITGTTNNATYYPFTVETWYRVS